MIQVEFPNRTIRQVMIEQIKVLPVDSSEPRRLRHMLRHWSEEKWEWKLSLKETEDEGYFEWRFTLWNRENAQQMGSFYSFEFVTLGLFIQYIRIHRIAKAFVDEYEKKHLALIAQCRLIVEGADG